MAGLGCGFSQPAPPQSPTRLHPLGLRGWKAEFPASNVILLSAHTTSKSLLDYSTRRVYLLRRGLSNLQLLDHALACHVAQPPRRHRQTSLQTSRRILDERDIGQSRAAEPRPQLEPLLKRLLVIFIRCVFNDDSVVTFALPFPSSRISTSRGGEASLETNFTMSSYNKHIG
jgi:hypothetical protein